MGKVWGILGHRITTTCWAVRRMILLRAAACCSWIKTPRRGLVFATQPIWCSCYITDALASTPLWPVLLQKNLPVRNPHFSFFSLFKCSSIVQPPQSDTACKTPASAVQLRRARRGGRAAQMVEQTEWRGWKDRRQMVEKQQEEEDSHWPK